MEYCIIIKMSNLISQNGGVKMKKRCVVVSAILMAALALTGCGGQKAQQEQKAMTAEEILVASSNAMEELDSYGFTMNMTMNMDMKENGSMNMDMVTTAEAILKPQVLIKMDSDITMELAGEKQNVPMTQYIEGTDTGLVLYQEMQGFWGKIVMDDPSLVESMTQNPQESLKAYQESMEKAEILAEEKVGDRDCYKIEMTLSQEALDEVMAGFGSANLDADTIAMAKEMMSNAGGLSTIVWVDKENYQMLKQSMDISELIRQAMVAELKNANQSEDSIGDVTMDMEILYQNYNGISEIVIPDEAKNAQEISL